MNDSKEKNNRVVGKVIAVIVAFAVMLATSFVVANFVHNRGNSQTVSNRGNSQTVSKVQNGLSAYELAVEQGYDGSVQDWLDSLKGKSAYDIAVENGYSGTEKDWSKATQAEALQKPNS